jgi:hypothetical protein
MEKVKKGRKKNSEALMTEEMQWWGVWEMMDFNPMPGGVLMNSDKVKRNVSAVDRKSKTNFKKGRKAMKTKLLILTVLLTTVCLFSFSSSEAATSSGRPYDCEEDLIEVMFAQDSRVRLRADALVERG